MLVGCVDAWCALRGCVCGRTHHTRGSSGNVTIETGFYDGTKLVSKSLVRVYYDA